MDLESFSPVASNHPGRTRLLDVLRSELATAERADIAVSFLRCSGLGLLLHAIGAFLARGGRVRVLTSTYLGVTQPDAVRALVGLVGEGQVRVFDAAHPGFHLKLFSFRRGGTASCWVGSSNLTKGGLSSNLELNVRHDESGVVASIHEEFELLWGHTATVAPTPAFIDAYAARLLASLPQVFSLTPAASPETLAVAESGAQYGVGGDAALAIPNEAQGEALERLAALRARGERRAVVIAAPGIGKTYLSAFDARAAGARRVLFVSHRLEHLRQAERTFKTVFPQLETALHDGTSGRSKATAAPLVFATVQSLASRPELGSRAWDYLVVDEFHHAHAPTYRAVIEMASDAFLLGLTATPERQDGHDVLELCDYNVAYEVRLHEAIARRWLVPFHYFAVADSTVDYASIPWRNGRFEPNKTEDALSVERRVDLALEHSLEKGYDGPRRATVGFCAGRRHAAYMAAAFRQRGRVAEYVTGDVPVAERERIYRDFSDPSHPLEWLFVADVLNEGVDIPAINSILFLRPTDSSTIFIQQLGRGLRLHPECEVLTVVDLVGHHRRAWLSLTSLQDPGAMVGVGTVEGLKYDITPPPGCEIVLDDATREILAKVERFVGRKKDRCREVWDEMRAELGRAPDPVDFIGRDADASPEDFRAAFGDWIGCRMDRGDAEPWEEALPKDAPLRAFLARVEGNWQAPRVYPWARVWAHVADRASPREAYLRFFERFPRWSPEGAEDGFDKAAKSLEKKLGHLFQREALDPRIYGVISPERLLLEVERRIRYQLEKDYRMRHGGVLRAPEDLALWRRYGRPEIINHFGRQYDPARHNTGVIAFSEEPFARDIVIITKLDTSGAASEYQYRNGFEEPSVFRWQSQNRNTPTDATGRRLVTPGAARLHLFVQERSHATAVYCGAVTPERHEGSAPIDVWFRLPAPVPPGVLRGIEGER